MKEALFLMEVVFGKNHQEAMEFAWYYLPECVNTPLWGVMVYVLLQGRSYSIVGCDPTTAQGVKLGLEDVLSRVEKWDSDIVEWQKKLVKLIMDAEGDDGVIRLET